MGVPVLCGMIRMAGHGARHKRTVGHNVPGRFATTRDIKCCNKYVIRKLILRNTARDQRKQTEPKRKSKTLQPKAHRGLS